jgi:hypothetical protein
LFSSQAIPGKEGSDVTRQIMVAAIAVGAFALVTSGARTARADDACFYKGTMYSDGATACQAGKVFECDDGEWDGQDKDCQDTGAMKTSRICNFEGVSYATGSAKCVSLRGRDVEAARLQVSRRRCADPGGAVGTELHDRGRDGGERVDGVPVGPDVAVQRRGVGGYRDGVPVAG